MSSGLKLALGGLLLVACADAPSPPVVTPLEGLWRGWETGGGGEQWTLNVESDRYFLQGPGGDDWLRGRFELEPAGRPGEVDLIIQQCDCRYVGERSLARYRLSTKPGQPSELVLASHEPGSAVRPARLTPGDGVRVVRFEHQQP